MRNFREYDIWKESVALTKEVYRLTKLFPDGEKFGLCSQMQRAAVSIPSNIAEGSSRKSEVDFARYLELALGSAFELETQLIIAYELKYISFLDFDRLLQATHVEQRKMNSFITKIRKG